MRRKLTDKLIEWKYSDSRLPLIVNGARQVGKTYTVVNFAKKEYANYVHINFDNNDEAKAIFEHNLDVNRIIMELEALTGVAIRQETTLLFFDEIQDAPRVLSSLKYFAEDAPGYHVIAAGSLLGVAINREGYSFPVGKVKSLRLHPFSFIEFLWSQGDENLANLIERHCQTFEKLSTPLHQKALELFKIYLIVGGMPASILAYNQRYSLLEIPPVLNQIVTDYLADMAKYASSSDTIKIRATFNSIPKQLAKENRKFQYKLALLGGTAQKFGTAIEWLEYAGLALKCNKITNVEIPLAVREEPSGFKLYMHDIGIITLLSETPPSAVLRLDEIDNTFLGAIAENYVAICLRQFNIPLRYWASQNTAEIDFVIQLEEEIIPIEVKKGLRSKSKSLAVYNERYHPKQSIRTSAKNFGKSGNLIAIPLYALEFWCMSLGI